MFTCLLGPVLKYMMLYLHPNKHYFPLCYSVQDRIPNVFTAITLDIRSGHLGVYGIPLMLSKWTEYA